jgi:hypothetical protein
MGISARRAALLFALGAPLCACASKPPPKPAQTAPAKGAIERLLPLVHDTVYSYETYTEQNDEKGVLVMQVRRPRTDLAELDVAGRIQRVYFSERSAALATGGYLLKVPIVVGAEWVGHFGAVRVTSVDRRVKVPAGDFEHCVETVETLETAEVKKRTLTVFCPKVGIVMRETEGQAGADVMLERMELKSYGPVFTYDPTQ